MLSILAIYLLSKKIEWEEVKQIIFRSSPGWLMIALILYILSKIVSAIRLNRLFKQINIHLPEWKNIKLYFIGMFYNLFLPGGIGGDGYKAYWIKKNFKAKTTKSVIAALFLDRFFGLSALFLLLFSGLFLTDIFQTINNRFQWLIILLLIAVIPFTYLMISLLFSSFNKAFWQSLILSILVQGIQLLEAISIIKAIGLSGKIINYLVLFLASSIASVLPISVGGIGVRELTFVYGNDLLAIQKNEAVAFSLIFFILTAISSFIGSFLNMGKQI